MKTMYLLPNYFKKIGLLLLFICVSLMITLQFIGTEENGIFDNVPVFAIWDTSLFDSDADKFLSIRMENMDFEILSILAIVGLLFVAFSKQKQEDEFISKIRLDSLLWATYAHYILLVILILIIYGISFLHVLVGEMFTLLVLFNIRFYYLVFKANSNLTDEE